VKELTSDKLLEQFAKDKGTGRDVPGVYSIMIIFKVLYNIAKYASCIICDGDSFFRSFNNNMLLLHEHKTFQFSINRQNYACFAEVQDGHGTVA
jgi:hypothetical protein